ncbi:DUF3718 domain-containing protein [Thalassotalea sp. M1531]|uniref:DUF3718 domain-containing protein n=1 Tax=Thalassotalea algicola TaxID=2716224 RepID=A0A7Y0LE07_9GAMM|nr:DUF3718 domain-containing protein [Thalassotalea algicola]NMP32835.1 DUF3718 domain-containing protein [Thalassotalea algicola]
MKTVLVAVLTLAVSFGASAKVSNVEFRALDQSVETQLCVAAAQGGLTAAKSTASSLGVKFGQIKNRLSCNDQSLIRFAAQFESQVEQPIKSVVFKFKAADNQAASQICKEAVVNGLPAVQKQYKNIDDIYCNGQIISRFVKKHRI